MSGPVKPYPWPTDEHFIAVLGGGLAASTLNGYVTAADRACLRPPFIVVGRERRWRIHPDDPWPAKGENVFSRATIDMWCDWYREARRCQLRSGGGRAATAASDTARGGDSRAKAAGSRATRKSKPAGSSKNSRRRTAKDTTSQRELRGTVVPMPEFRP